MTDLGRIKIGDFVLEPARNLLIGPGEEPETALEPKVVDVLLALAAKPGAVMNRDELIDAVWKREFGADERVTRAISQLRRAFGDERGAARYIETVSKRGYRLVAEVRSAEEASLASEATAPTASQIPPAAAPRPAWQTSTVAGFFVALAVFGIAAAVWRAPLDAPYAEDVVELRPLTSIDGKVETVSLARKVGASMRHILASNQVNVIDGAGARRTNGSSAKESEFVLSGAVEQSGDLHVVTLYFEDRSDGQTLWANRFVRPSAEVEELRDQIGANAAYIIACSLRQRRTARQKPSGEAFKAYIEACNPELYSEDDRKQLLATAHRLTAAAPNDSYGHALLASAYAGLSANRGLSRTQVETYQAESRKAGNRALELDPNDPLALITLAFLNSRSTLFRELEAHVGSAETAHPAVRSPYIRSLQSTGRLTEARFFSDQTVALAPLSAACRGVQAHIAMQQGDSEAAERIFAETLRLWPAEVRTRRQRFVNAAFYGERTAALRQLESKAMDLPSGQAACWRAFIDARARGDAAHMREACDGHMDSSYTIRMRAALRDIKGVYEMIEPPSFDWAGVEMAIFFPELDPVRRDPRFMSLVARSGLLEFWTETNHWPDFCSDTTLPYDCKAEAQRVLHRTAAKRAASLTRP